MDLNSLDKIESLFA